MRRCATNPLSPGPLQRPQQFRPPLANPQNVLYYTNTEHLFVNANLQRPLRAQPHYIGSPLPPPLARNPQKAVLGGNGRIITKNPAIHSLTGAPPCPSPPDGPQHPKRRFWAEMGGLSQKIPATHSLIGASPCPSAPAGPHPPQKGSFGRKWADYHKKSRHPFPDRSPAMSLSQI